MSGAFFVQMPNVTDRDLAEDPSARVLVFIDGQNLYKRCRELFGHPLCHPNLLAEYLAGPRTATPPGCRFYTGRPDQNLDPTGARNLDRRLAGMRNAGVTVVTRQLRYHWDWSSDSKLPRPGPGVPSQMTRMSPWRRPQEKGIDLVLGLDVIEFVVSNVCDVAIVVSLDRDLYEIPQALRNLAASGLLRGRRFRLEAAVPVADDQKAPKTLPGFAYTHQINSQVFGRCRDNTNYTVADDTWTSVAVPARLPPVAAPPEPTLFDPPSS